MDIPVRHCLVELHRHPIRRVLRIGEVGLQPTVSSLDRVPRAMP